MSLRLLVLAVVVAGAVGLFAQHAPPVHAATLTVCPIGCQYATIQAAINAAAANDTIVIAPGNYTENLSVGGGAATPLTLRGLGVIVDGNGAGTVLSVSAGKSVEVSDLTLRNGIGFHSGGIVNSGTLRLMRVRVTAGQATGGAGGGIHNFGTLEASLSEISGNSSTLYGGGIDNSGTATLTNEVVSN
jgi:hypothetical protein